MSMMTAVGCYAAQARVFAQSSSPEPVMDALSAYVSPAASRVLPAEAADHAKHHLLDTLAAMISGSQLLPGQAALRYAIAHAGKGAATIVGSTLTAGPGGAALRNGGIGHTCETDG